MKFMAIIYGNKDLWESFPAEDWPKAIAAVTLDQVKAVAQKYIELRKSVTGTMIPIADPDAAATAKPSKS